MLITLALLLILVTMLWGFGSRSHQQQQKRACEKNLATIHVALEIYAKEHTGRLPQAPGAETSETPLAPLVPSYTVASELFICPGSKDSSLPNGESFAKRRISYAYFMGRRLDDTNAVLMSDRQVNTRPKRAGEPVFSAEGKPPGNNHHKYGGNFLFTDGHVETSGPRAPFAIEWPTNIVLLNPRP
jgi:prepilin-type processing-associated H-X9-DG protein